MADTAKNDNDDLELESEGNSGLTQSPSVRKNIPLKLKGKGRGRGRRGGRTKKVLTRKGIIEEQEEDDDELDKGDDMISDHKFELEDDISKLEMPSFTTLERGPPEPLHQSKTLKWDHKVNLIGEKVVNPMIHCCEKCSLPILIYGRMIPCKHVFCSDCANKADKLCPRCNEKVQRVEHSALGTVFLCTFGGPRHGVGGCKRTYLSQRDLQAHIGHRHLRPSSNSSGSNSSNSSSATTPPILGTSQSSSHNLAGRDPRANHTPLSSETAPAPARTPPHSQHHSIPHVSSHGHVQEYRDPPDPGRPPSILPAPPAPSVTGNVQPRNPHPFTHPSVAHGPSYQSPIPVVSTRSNLITVPIQDDSGTASPSPHIHQQPHLSPYASHSPSTHPPPPIPVNPYPQPSHHFQPTHPNPPYSQPPLGTQTFNPPPAHIPPPTIHNPNPPIYSPHNPPPVHHPPPPNSYNAQPVRNNPLPPMPPQRFPGNSSYDEGSYPPPSWSSGPPPPRAHGPLPPPRPLSGPHMNQQCGPSDPGYRPPYYP